MEIAKQDAKDVVAAIFKNDNNEPFILTDGQADIFNTIWLRKHARNQIITPTRYGKSETIAMATLLRSVVFKEKWLILAGSTEKTQIIMSKLIQHLYDHPMLEAQIDHSNLPQIERLKHKRNVEHLTWVKGGEVKTLTADARNRKRVKESLTGHGAANIVEDEATLIPDDLQGMAMRMLGDQPDSYLLKIGNPFYRNHFYRTWHSDKYNKIFIDYHQALREERFTEEFVEEMRHEPFFRELYECEFPDEDAIMEGGYQRLISDKMLEDAMVDKLPEGETPEYLGCDFAGGGNDRSAYVARNERYMWKLSTNRSANTMDQVTQIRDYIDEYQLESQLVFTDAGGLGKGVGDRLEELDMRTTNIQFGQSAFVKEKYKNVRAEMYYGLYEWIKNGGRIVADDDWFELTSIYFKTDSEKKFQIQPKEELKKRMREQGIKASSPDVADAAALCFAQDTIIGEDDWFII